VETAGDVERLEVDDDLGEARESGERGRPERGDGAAAQVQRDVVVVGGSREVGHGGQVAARDLLQHAVTPTAPRDPAAAAGGGVAVGERERTGRGRDDARHHRQ